MKTMKGFTVGLVGLLTAASALAASPLDAPALETAVMEELVVVGKHPDARDEPRFEFTAAPIEVDLAELADKIVFTPEIRLEF